MVCFHKVIVIDQPLIWPLIVREITICLPVMSCLSYAGVYVAFFHRGLLPDTEFFSPICVLHTRLSFGELVVPLRSCLG
jgi:hypothetical protein